MKKGKFLWGSSYYANKKSVGMKKILVLSFCCFLALTILACESKIEIIDEPEQVEEITLSQDDFVLRIDTLPYRGAVLFIDYNGDMDITEYALSVDISLNDSIMQEGMLVEDLDGNLIAEIIDLMYVPNEVLDIILKIKRDQGETERYKYLLTFEGYYPWKDWIFNTQERVFLWSDEDKTLSDSEILEFVYEGTDRAFTPSGAHASWDLYDGGKMLDVYSGTVGVVYMTFEDKRTGGDVRIYNPHVGAIVQYGHLVIDDEIAVGKIVEPGDRLGNVLRPWDHVHYSVIRPYSYLRDAQYATHCLSGLITEDRWDGYYWPKPWDIDGHYNDPFYWHEPTTLGYWNEETMPSGFKDHLLNIFKRDNPNVILPATKPLNAD
jgi:hypothetical protein